MLRKTSYVSRTNELQFVDYTLLCRLAGVNPRVVGQCEDVNAMWHLWNWAPALPRWQPDRHAAWWDVKWFWPPVSTQPIPRVGVAAQGTLHSIRAHPKLGKGDVQQEPSTLYLSVRYLLYNQTKVCLQYWVWSRPCCSCISRQPHLRIHLGRVV